MHPELLEEAREVNADGTLYATGAPTFLWELHTKITQTTDLSKELRMVWIHNSWIIPNTHRKKTFLQLTH